MKAKTTVKTLRALALPLAGLLATVALLFAGAGGAQAAPTPGGYIRICDSSISFTMITEFDLDGSSGAGYFLSAGQCTPWLYATGIRVDTDPGGPSHSYRIAAVGTGSNGAWGACHTNSDNHESNPPQSSTADWTIWYRNYDNGNCTN